MLKESEQWIREIGQILIGKGHKLGFAESCTGGLIAATVASQAGVSAFFSGAVVSYAGDVKKKVLKVPAEEIEQFGEVSEEVVKSMALGARESLNSEWVVSVSGIAGPTGGTKEKPVGTVCFGFVGPNFVETQTEHFLGTRIEIQKQSMIYALKGLLQRLKN
ncbi:MAG: CinA family protein [Bdellovibrionales bacterium]|nr:CinA family protein [Bdellovibrionales bacterium]